MSFNAVGPNPAVECDEKGQIRPKEPFTLPPGSRILITVLESDGSEPALLSEGALATDWERPEEEAAWVAPLYGSVAVATADVRVDVSTAA